MTLSRTDLALMGVGAALPFAIALAIANFAGDGENGGAPEYAITLGGSIIAAAALFGWFIPRAVRPGRAGLVVGLLGVLSLAAFWSGLPFVLGPAALALGVRGGGHDEGPARSWPAIALGALVTAAAIAAVAVDRALQASTRRGRATRPRPRVRSPGPPGRPRRPPGRRARG